MKPEHIKIIGTTVLWMFAILNLIIVLISKTVQIPENNLFIFKVTYEALEFFGASIWIAGNRIEKMENKKKKESED